MLEKMILGDWFAFASVEQIVHKAASRWCWDPLDASAVCVHICVCGNISCMFAIIAGIFRSILIRTPVFSMCFCILLPWGQCCYWHRWRGFSLWAVYLCGRSKLRRTLKIDLFKQPLCRPLQWTGTSDIGFGGWVSELVLHSENTVGLWGRVSMSFLAFAWYFMFLTCHNASSPFSVSLFQFAHQPSGPEEHLCPSSFPICPMPLSLAPNCSADNLFITDMN